jgi:pyridoxal biosynthesis lyase PdxS
MSQLDSLETRVQSLAAGQGDIRTAVAGLTTTQTYQTEILEEVRSSLKAQADLYQRVTSLEATNTKRSNRIKAVGKWTAGVAATVVAAALLILFGIK